MKKSTFLFAAIVMALFSAVTYAQNVPESTDVILEKAYAQATKEHKNVMVLFHASWCGWCKKMDASLNDPTVKKSFDDNYVFVWLTVMESTPELKKTENPGALELMTKYHAEKSGIPFFLIFDNKGKFLADSYIRAAGVSMDTPGDNMGCPASEKELAAFNNILKQTSRIKEPQLTLIRQRFSKNAEPAAAPVPAPKPTTGSR